MYYIKLLDVLYELLTLGNLDVSGGVAEPVLVKFTP